MYGLSAVRLFTTACWSFLWVFLFSGPIRAAVVTEPVRFLLSPQQDQLLTGDNEAWHIHPLINPRKH